MFVTEMSEEQDIEKKDLVVEWDTSIPELGRTSGRILFQVLLFIDKETDARERIGCAQSKRCTYRKARPLFTVEASQD